MELLKKLKNQFIVPSNSREAEEEHSDHEKIYDVLLDYVIKGSPAPPPHNVKMATIGLYQQLSGYKIFVETGTLVGETVEAASNLFRECHSVELSEKHHNIAKDRLSGKRNVKLHLGSSDELLPKILNTIKSPAVIWLDAHHSGDDTAGEGMDPLKKELETILKHKNKNHIVLIDDARGLGVTKKDLDSIVKRFGNKYHASVLNDSVRIVPKNIELFGPKYTAS